MEYTEHFRRIDMQSYPRRAHFDYFNSLAYPYVGVTVNADITPLMAFRRESGAPFFLTLLYCASRAANSVPELRQRILGGQIIEYDLCPSSHTVAKPDGTYAYCTLRADGDMNSFIERGRREQEACVLRGNIEERKEDALSYLFVSSLPWLSYTALIQPTPIPADSNPRISWGKRFEQGGRTLLPLSLLCHHALADGLHISHFYEAFEAEISRLKPQA